MCPAPNGAAWSPQTAFAITQASKNHQVQIVSQIGSWDTMNLLWAMALNKAKAGEIDRAAMIHADIQPQIGWLDQLEEIRESHGAEFLSVVAAQKETSGLTACGIGDIDDPWCPHRRFTMREVWKDGAKETFSAEDICPERFLLHNTACWIADMTCAKYFATERRADGREYSFSACDFNWCRSIQIVNGEYHCRGESEDWYFSRMLHKLGVKSFMTRAIPLDHMGQVSYPNTAPWGTQEHDVNTKPKWQNDIQDESGNTTGTTCESSQRKFLVYVAGAFPIGDIFGADRTYDIALNNFDGQIEYKEHAEYRFCHKGEKWPSIVANLNPAMLAKYDAVCFLDDDIEISTDTLNKAFADGLEAKLSVWQVSLTPDSHYGWPHTVCGKTGAVRRVPFIEIMMPIFSREALAEAWPTFAENESGWGIDFLYSQLFHRSKVAILDNLTAKHARPIQSQDRVMKNGKKAVEEATELCRKHKLSGEQYGRFSYKSGAIRYFIPDCPPGFHSGGVNLLWKNLEVLNSLGFQAERLNGHFTPDDVLVIPEVAQDVIAQTKGRCKTMMMVLNPFYLFQQPKIHLADCAITNSPFTADMLERIGVKTHLFTTAIDPKRFFPDEKKYTLCYMRRKSEHSIESLRKALASIDPSLAAIHFVSIDNFSDEEYDRTIRRSHIFLSLSPHEGWSGAMYEAQRSRTIVAGYDGGQPYLKHAIFADNFINLAFRLAPLLKSIMGGDKSAFEGMIDDAYHQTLQLTPEAEAASLKAIFDECTTT